MHAHLNKPVILSKMFKKNLIPVHSVRKMLGIASGRVIARILFLALNSAKAVGRRSSVCVCNTSQEWDLNAKKKAKIRKR